MGLQERILKSKAMTNNTSNHTGTAVPQDQTILELRNVRKSFGTLQVLRGVNLKIWRGQTVVIVGESGAGKSVLLKLMIGLLRPDSGEIFFKGTRIDNLPERKLIEFRRRMGFVFQMGALFDSLTAGENVAFPLREHTDYDKETISRIVKEKLKLVGLEDVEHKRPSELSGGQRKRVALARALALDPEVIFFDEPTTGLDPMRADVINELILKLKTELKVTAVVVTHDMTSAFKIADRIVMLWQGDFIADAPPEQFRHASDERVRMFVEGRASQDDLAALRAE